MTELSPGYFARADAELPDAAPFFSTGVNMSSHDAERCQPFPNHSHSDNHDELASLGKVNRERLFANYPFPIAEYLP